MTDTSSPRKEQSPCFLFVWPYCAALRFLPSNGLCILPWYSSLDCITSKILSFFALPQNKSFQSFNEIFRVLFYLRFSAAIFWQLCMTHEHNIGGLVV